MVIMIGDIRLVLNTESGNLLNNFKMMTDEQILKLASKYLELHPIHGDESVWNEWCGKQEDLLKFARCLLDYGFSEGHFVPEETL